MQAKTDHAAVAQRLLAISAYIGLTESISVLERERETVAVALSRFGATASTPPARKYTPRRRPSGHPSAWLGEVRRHHPVESVEAVVESNRTTVPGVLSHVWHAGKEITVWDTIKGMMAKGPAKVSEITHGLRLKGFVKDETPETKREIMELLVANKEFSHVTRGTFAIRKNKVVKSA